MSKDRKSPKDKIIMARGSDLFPPGFHTANWTLIMREGVAWEDVLRPSFWSALASTLGIGNHYHRMVDVVRAEKDFYAQVYIRSVQQGEVFVKPVIEPKHFDEEIVTESNVLLEPRWNISLRGYDVIRIADKHIMKDGKDFPLKEQAQEWIDEHMKTLGLTKAA